MKRIVRSRFDVSYPELPDDNEPVSELWARKATKFNRRAARRKAERWLPVSVPETGDKPFLIAAVGDIHADSDGCNVPLLRRDLGLLAATKGAYAIHVGDAVDNWIGSLARLSAHSSTTKKDSFRLAHWIMHESGVRWLFHILGNHDKWGDGAAMLGLMGGQDFLLFDWEARVELRAGEHAIKLHAKHDFKGHSDWNKTHGPLKAAYKESAADILIAGHRHDFGTQCFELSGLDRVVNVIRARGYKFDDDHALMCGFPETQSGSTVAAIIDPTAKSLAGRVTVVPDLELACRMLTALRAPRQVKSKKPKARKAKRK